MRTLLGVLALALALPGCALPERGEGEETLVIANDSGQDLSVILRIIQEGGIEVYADEVFLSRGASAETPVVMAAAKHTVYLTTTNRLSERFPIEIPERGDSRIEVVVKPRSASVTVSR